MFLEIALTPTDSLLNQQLLEYVLKLQGETRDHVTFLKEQQETLTTTINTVMYIILALVAFLGIGGYGSIRVRIKKHIKWLNDEMEKEAHLKSNELKGTLSKKYSAKIKELESENKTLRHQMVQSTIPLFNSKVFKTYDLISKDVLLKFADKANNARYHHNIRIKANDDLYSTLDTFRTSGKISFKRKEEGKNVQYHEFSNKGYYYLIRNFVPPLRKDDVFTKKNVLLFKDSFHDGENEFFRVKKEANCLQQNFSIIFLQDKVPSEVYIANDENEKLSDQKLLISSSEKGYKITFRPNGDDQKEQYYRIIWRWD